MKNKTLYVVDGHALCYRAYYAMANNPLINSAGQNVSAIYGFARMLYKLAAEREPDYLVIAFDPPVKSFRFKLYDEYKATRHKMPEDLKLQIDEIKNMADSLGICRIENNDLEGDDIMGGLAAKYSKDMEVWLVTGDKDAYQLLDDNVFIYAPKKGIGEYEVYDKNNIVDKIGMPPEKVVDYMSLTGDASDNIPGVFGVGEKTALKLINEYGSLDGVYANTDKLAGKLKEKIEAGRESAYLSKELVTIKRDAPPDIDLSAAGCASMYSEAAQEYFRKIEMPGIIKDYLAKAKGIKGEAAQEDRSEEQPDVIPSIEKHYVLVRTDEELAAMIKQIRMAGLVSVDTETTSAFPMEAELVGISFSTRGGEGFYVPMVSKGMFADDYVEPSRSLALIKPVLEDADIKKIGQNIKYDMIVLARAGVKLAGVYFDTMIASYLLTPNERRHNLDDLADKYLSYKTTTYKELTGSGKNAVAITDVPLDMLADYAAEDADVAYRLYDVFNGKLVGAGLNDLFFNVEMKMASVLAYMETAGVKIDAPYFASLKKENDGLLKDVEAKIYAEAGRQFNINSTRELATILFDELGLARQKKTKTGYSTDINVLESLKGRHPIIDSLISYRTLSKLKGTYIDALPQLVNPDTGRIHTSYNQTVAATGRLSSSEPNLQNIPVRDEFGKKIRKGFVPDDGFVMLAADYSQIELRLAAHLSGDAAMISAFKDGKDIHASTAASVFGVDIADVTPEMRRQAKTINFATIYGVSPFGLSKQAEIDIKEAAEFIRLYFEAYSGFKAYIDSTIAFAREHGYVQTMLGRRRDIPEINSSAAFRREGAERMAINTPIQGSSADMIKLAMIKIFDEFTNAGLRSKMILQVHDELVFEVAENEREQVSEIVKNSMENAMRLSVPVVVDFGWGGSWEEAH